MQVGRVYGLSGPVHLHGQVYSSASVGAPLPYRGKEFFSGQSEMNAAAVTLDVNRSAACLTHLSPFFSPLMSSNLPSQIPGTTIISFLHSW